MAKYKCLICGYVYDEDLGQVKDNIAPGTKFSSLADDYSCPLCGTSKKNFVLFKEDKKEEKEEIVNLSNDKHDLSELTNGQISLILSNLKKGCEKQYRYKEAELYDSLAKFYKEKALKDEEVSFNNSRNNIYATASSAADLNNDRGAKRALTWSSKVTLMNENILANLKKYGVNYFKDKSIYVCDICGFIYIGNKKPDVCPVCKVPGFKLIEITRGKK